jgi:hypothetical protein
MRTTLAVIALLIAVSAPRAGDRKEVYEKSKYISPAQADGSHYLFDHKGRPTLSQKKEKGEKAEKKKKTKDKKRKKMTRKPGKRRPKGYYKGRRTKAPPPAEDVPAEAPEAGDPPPDVPDAEEPPDAEPEGDGAGFDYGGVNVDDDAKVAIPGGSGPSSGDSFKPAPPQVQ